MVCMCYVCDAHAHTHVRVEIRILGRGMACMKAWRKVRASLRHQVQVGGDGVAGPMVMIGGRDTRDGSEIRTV